MPERPRALPPYGRDEGVHLEGEGDHGHGDHEAGPFEGVELPVPIEVGLVGVLGARAERFEGAGAFRR